jgi:cation:H+ antiporter
MTTLTLAAFAAGLALLVGGADLLVRGASRLATAAGVSPLVIGLTVVAFGTSAPELAASLGASLAGSADLALGNVVGSNVFNVLAILGLSALVAPLAVAVRLVRIDVPIVVMVSLGVTLLAVDGRIGRVDGLVLLAAIVLHTGWLVRAARRESRAVEDEFAAALPAAGAGTAGAVVAVVVGLALVVVGARWLVDAAVAIATAMGVGERVVGLTLVAAGTSLPELATSVVAAVRGQRDIAVGNVVGSNLFNLTAVLGAAAVGSSGGIAVAGEALRVDLPVMVLTAAVCVPVFFTGFEISRREGVAFVVAFVAYLTWLVADAVDREVPAAVTVTVLAVGGVALAASVVESVRQLRRSAR